MATKVYEHGSRQMMACGCAAQGYSSGSLQAPHDPPVHVCVIHDCVDVAEAPDLTGRIARCLYKHGICRNQRSRDSYRTGVTKPDYGQFDDNGRSFAPSSLNLPFFKHQPDKPEDEYYCGCMGWD